MQHPSVMSRAGLRGLRRSLGLTVRALATAMQTTPRTVHGWERGDRPISRENARLLAALAAYTDSVVDRLAAEDPILTYETDDEIRGVDTGGWMLTADWHQAAAWRASERTGARIVYSDRPDAPAPP